MADVASRRIGIGRKISRWDIKVSPYLYISPFFITFAVFSVFPIAYNIYVSMHDWHRRLGAGDFVGFDNFAWVLRQPQFWSSLQNTFSIWLISGIPQLIMAMFIAAILDQNLRYKTFWRMSVLVPFVVMPVATSLIFSQVFSQWGLIVPHMSELGIFADLSAPFVQNRLLSHVAIATMVNFRWTGYNALILLAAMQAVPRELYEAATVDGAGRLRQFFSVTIPNIRATTIFVILTMTIGGLQIFDEVRMFDEAGSGGSNNQWGTVVLYLYNLAFGEWQNRLGQAAAVGWLFAIVILLFSVVNFLITRSISSSTDKPSKVSQSSWRALVADRRRKADAARDAAFAEGKLTLLGDVSTSSESAGSPTKNKAKEPRMTGAGR